MHRYSCKSYYCAQILLRSCSPSCMHTDNYIPAESLSCTDIAIPAEFLSCTDISYVASKKLARIYRLVSINKNLCRVIILHRYSCMHGYYPAQNIRAELLSCTDVPAELFSCADIPAELLSCTDIPAELFSCTDIPQQRCMSRPFPPTHPPSSLPP